MQIFVNRAQIRIDSSIKCKLKNAESINSFIKTAWSDDTLNKTLIIGKPTFTQAKEWIAKFRVINAAGGMVLNSQQQTLSIIRNSYYDLPKGKLEKHEDYKSAALREIEEECGVCNIMIKNKTPFSTFHIYFHKNKWVLKRTKWFLMNETIPNKSLKAQAEEGITDVLWLNPNFFMNDNIQTFANIKLVAKHFTKIKV